LLAILRIVIRLIAENFNGSSARSASEYSAEHPHESLFPREATGAEAVSVSGQIDSCRALI